MPNDPNPTERLGMVPAMPRAVVHELPTSLREEQPIRLLIADEQRLFRLGLAQLLGADSRVEVVGLASDGEEAVLQCEELRPDVAMLDLRMTGVTGLEATRRIVALDTGTKVVILTASVRDGDVACAFESGASGYVLKDSDADVRCPERAGRSSRCAGRNRDPGRTRSEPAGHGVCAGRARGQTHTLGALHPPPGRRRPREP